MLNSLVSDSLSRIRNGYMSGKSNIELIHSKHIAAILDVLQKEGYVGAYETQEKPTAGKRAMAKYITLSLVYNGGIPATKVIKSISKPGCKRYIRTKDLLTFYNQFGRSGLGTVILSTSSGILAGDQALKRNIGGELLCVVF